MCSSDLQHQAGMGQHVANHHPLDHRDLKAEMPDDVGEGDVDHRVQRHHRGAETDHRQAGISIAYVRVSRAREVTVSPLRPLEQGAAAA